MSQQTPFSDGCPECVETLNAPKTMLVFDGTASCIYQCSGCGHVWFCNWATDGRLFEEDHNDAA